MSSIVPGPVNLGKKIIDGTSRPIRTRRPPELLNFLNDKTKTRFYMESNQNEEELSPQESLKLITKMLDKVQDDELWKIAKKRSTFKVSVGVYLIINAFLVGLWYYTTGTHAYFWPAWPMLGWGLGIVFQYFDAYLSTGIFSEEKEFEKLKRKKRDGESKK
jgi:hypothetical protein